MKVIINSELSLKEAQIALERKWKKDKFLVLNIQRQVRTLTQNGSMHLYFEMLAYELNAAGFDVMKTMKHDFEIPWNEKLIKELLWTNLQLAMFGIKSTAELNTKQVGEVYKVLDKHLADKLGVSVDWPCKDNM